MTNRAIGPPGTSRCIQLLCVPLPACQHRTTHAMFLIPSHLRTTLHSILTASPLDGPHTALLTSVQGVLYVSGSTYDADWDESLERPDPAEDAVTAGADEKEKGEEEGEDDVEPDLSMPEWRRTLRGMANKEWKDHIEQGGKDTERLRLQCDVSLSLFIS